MNDVNKLISWLKVPSIYLDMQSRKCMPCNISGGLMKDCYKCNSSLICTLCKNNKFLDSENKGCV